VAGEDAKTTVTRAMNGQFTTINVAPIMRKEIIARATDRLQRNAGLEA